MKKSGVCVGIITALAMGTAVVCMMNKKPKKSGVRHAAAKLIEGVNEFLDDLGMW